MTWLLYEVCLTLICSGSTAWGPAVKDTISGMQFSVVDCAALGKLA